MQPTPKLRFIERRIVVFKTLTSWDSETMKVLQQWWENEDRSGEWRDVMTAPEE